jgi:hypothetical protein
MPHTTFPWISRTTHDTPEQRFRLSIQNRMEKLPERTNLEEMGNDSHLETKNRCYICIRKVDDNTALETFITTMGIQEYDESHKDETRSVA